MADALEVVRFIVAPEERKAFLRDRPAAIAALRERFGGLLDATLAELDDGTWIDVLRWRSREEALAAAEQFSSIPQAASWASHIAEVREMAHGEVRDLVREEH
jgi:hypothetical protein